MSDIDLLELVQPSGGWFAVVGIKGDKIAQRLVETRGEVDELVAKFVGEGRDVYFGVAKYKTGEGRVKDNVLALKALWLDIDCGPNKAIPNPKTGRPAGYATQQEGLDALRGFCQHIDLPEPLLVNSGRGLHVYWPLEEPLERGEWEQLATRLRDLCNLHGLFVDNAVFEVARILRVPGTLNFKDDPPSPVTVIQTTTPVSHEKFRKILGVKEAPVVEAPPKRELTALAKSMQDNSYSSFAKIMRRSMKGDGCPQLLSCYEERATLEEPRWFDALSIAKFCRDRDDAIHKLSADHPDYNPAETEHKTKHILGPHGCASFENNNPGGCEGCSYFGKIKSPIVLGKVIEEAKPEDCVVKEPVEEDVEDVVDPEDAEQTPDTNVIPKYPDPFFRGKNGGIYKRNADPEKEPLFVYEHDFYVVKRMFDPVVGDAVLLRVHMPCDGAREFILANSKVSEKNELRRGVAAYGVMCSNEKQWGLIYEYVTTSLRNMQFKRKVEQMRLQFGWADNDSKFIVGDREISKDGIYHSPPSSITREIANFIGPVGDFEKWREVFNLYGRPGLEPHAFAALTAFGAPLFKFTGQRGALLNVIHPRSGTGKTTILHMCNSVWGAPDRLCATKDDTLNAKIMRLGVHNNLPFTADEITNMLAQDFSTLAYSITQGRGKDRVKASSNELRVNVTSWQTIALCSSNSSFYEKMPSYKTSADAELMRLVEYKIEKNSAIETMFGKEMFDHQLMHNYGHAGLIYAEWVLNNLEEVKATLLSTQRKLDNELRLTARERFWSALIAANITGGRIAKRLRLIDWDMPAIFGWSSKMLLTLREEVEAPMLNAVEVVGDYINRHNHNILSVDDGMDLRTNMHRLPYLEPRGELLIRVEPDTKRMYLTASAFKTDCVKAQVNYKEITKQLQERGIFLGTVNKRLSKGSKVSTLPVRCLELDTSNPDFLDLEAVIPTTEDNDAGGGS